MKTMMKFQSYLVIVVLVTLVINLGMQKFEVALWNFVALGYLVLWLGAEAELKYTKTKQLDKHSEVV